MDGVKATIAVGAIAVLLYGIYRYTRPATPPGYGVRPYGVPKTQPERLATHIARYGDPNLPPRGTGLGY